MLEWLKANKVYGIAAVIILVCVLYFTFRSDHEENADNQMDWNEIQQQSSQANEEQKNDENRSDEESKIIVDVKGAVIKPGVYEAEIGERVIDLINRAGGLREKADEKNINFAMRVTDEMVLYIPKIGEEIEGVQSVNSSTIQIGSNSGDKVNINNANETELQTLPGIGPSRATSIIEYRETNGPFKTIDDIKSISGIGDKTFEKLQERITVN